MGVNLIGYELNHFRFFSFRDRIPFFEAGNGLRALAE